MSVAILEKKIIEAFSVIEKPYMYNDVMQTLDWERKQVVKLFNGKEIDEITVRLIKRYGSHLDPMAICSLLPTEFYRYYLQGFLLMVLRHCKELDVFCDSIVYSFFLKFTDGSCNELVYERLCSFDKEQLDVLIQFCSHVKRNYQDFLIPPNELNRAIASIRFVRIIKYIKKV